MFHASLDERLCVLLKLDEVLLTAFCDHRRGQRQVRSWGGATDELYRVILPPKIRTARGESMLCPPPLITGDIGQPGGLPGQGPGGLAGDQRLQRDERKTKRLQHLLRLPAAL